MTNADAQSKHEIALRAFLSEMGWDEEIDHDRENEFISVRMPITIGGNDNLLIIDAHQNDIIDVFVYMRFLNVKSSKLDQMHILLSLINSQIRIGAFQFVQKPQWEVVRWRHSTDFEGSNPNHVTLRQQVVTGLNTVEEYSDTIAAVALTNQTAHAAMEDFTHSLGETGG